MKKLILSFSTVTLIITGIFTFAGCEKEEGNNIQTNQCTTCEAAHFHYGDAYYEQQNRYFAENYGIDVHEFSNNEHLINLILDFNELASDILDFMADASQEQLEESIHLLEQKQNELQDFENSGDNFGMLSVAEEIFATLMPSKPMNEYFYEGNFYQLPIDYMQAKNEFLSCKLHQLKEFHPSLQNMPEDDFKKLLETSAYILATDENHADLFYALPEPPNAGNRKSLEECWKNADNKFHVQYIKCVAAAGTMGISCAFTPPPFNILCITLSAIIIATELYLIKNDYDMQIQDCWERYS